MRDKYAPIIEGFDLSGVVNRYSLQCEQFYVEGDNGGTLLDGSTVTDALAAHVRLSWTLNSLSAAQYAALTAALGSGDSPDTVRAYAFDPSCNAVRCATFHVTRPLFQFAFDAGAGQMMSFAGGELVLEEAAPVARFEVTPPTKTAYDVGDALDLTGLSVTRYDPDGNASDITAECTLDPAPGSAILTAGAVTLTVHYDNAPIAAIPLTVAPSEIIAGGDWWTLFSTGRLYIRGNTPNFGDNNRAPWDGYRSQITSVTIADGVTIVGSEAFFACSALTSVTIPDGVTSIGYRTFYNCSSLTSVTIPDSVTIVGSRAFIYCSSLTSVTIPDSVTIVGSEAFFACSALTSVTIPDGVTSIEMGAFGGCSSLTSVTIPDGVTIIGEEAFESCSSLTSVTIPDGVTIIGEEAFGGCIALTSVTIPDSVTSIGRGAFGGCSSLTSVTIPNGVTSIKMVTFKWCYSLVSVTIPDSVTSIGGDAFFDCRALTDIYYGGSQAQWGAISISGGNDALTGATIHYTEPPQ